MNKYAGTTQCSPHKIFSIKQDLNDGETCINFYEKIEAHHR